MHNTYETAMLICGIVLFLFGLGLIVFLARAGKSFVSAAALLPVAVIMIGFPLIKSAKIGLVEIDTKAAEDFAKHPDKPEAKAAYDGQLAAAEKTRNADPTAELPPETRTALQSVAQSLASAKNLSAESRTTLARTQLLLGQAKEATANTRAVMTVKPQLITANPTLHMLVRVSPTPPNP